jgi:hypothetical protein
MIQGNNGDWGNYSVGIGTFAMGYNGGITPIAPGVGNTAVGALTLTRISSSATTRNSALGYNAGLLLGAGANNTYVGSYAGQNHVTGSSNIFVGDSAGSGIVSGSNNTIIGSFTGLTASLNNTLLIGTGTTRRIFIDATGSGYISGSLSYTGSLQGTASYATTHAVMTSSYICNGILSADTSFATGSDFIIPFDDQYDPQNWLSGSRFTPTIAGYYHLDFGVWLNNPGVSTNQTNAQMRKNGNSWVLVQQQLINSTGQSLAGSKIIFLNGTTDYVDWTIYQATGASATGTILKGTADGSGTWFSAFLLTM